jgi:hypothetical protein
MQSVKSVPAKNIYGNPEAKKNTSKWDKHFYITPMHFLKPSTARNPPHFRPCHTVPRFLM